MTIENPQAYTKAYSKQNQEQVENIIQWMNDNNRIPAWLAKLSKTNASTLSGLLAGKYPSDPSKWLRKLRSVISNYKDRMGEDTFFIKTTVYDIAVYVFKETRKDGGFGLVTGNVGIGKTVSAKRYVEETPYTLLVETDPRMTPKELLIDILSMVEPSILSEAKKKSGNRNTKLGLLRTAVEVFKGTSYLLIIDEAEKTNDQCFDYLRRISDKTDIGIVLMGNEQLQIDVTSKTIYDQVNSRTYNRSGVLRGADRKDIRKTIEYMLKDQAVTDKEIERIWRYIGGSMRFLIKAFMKELKMAIKKYPLSVSTIDAIATRRLNLPEIK